MVKISLWLKKKKKDKGRKKTFINDSILKVSAI